MNELIKKIILLLIPHKFKLWINQEFVKDGFLTYSQEGEDRVIQRLLNWRESGVYVDIGAHHPKRINNTYYFYKQGWHGINIDAMPHSMDQFKTLRPKDINLEIPISDIEEELTFFMFNQPYLNTFDSSLLNEHLNYPGIKLEKEIKLKTKRLETILDEYLSKLNSSKIDFFSIDVEGWDLRVLKSNNWELYRPEYILVEELFTNIIETLDGEIANYLKTVGYQLIAKTNETSFYKRN